MSTCPQCGSDFTPARPRQRFCCQKCQVKAANDRRSSTRLGRKMAPSKPAQAVSANVATEATIAQLFGQWFVRVDGWLTLGPMDQQRGQDHADRINSHGQ